MHDEFQARPLELLQMDPVQLRNLSAGRRVDWGAMQIVEGSLPSHKAIARAVSQWQSGVPALWCLPCLIVTPSRASSLGACGFKGPPLEGTVEIYYCVGSSHRGRGIASQAVQLLLQIARLQAGVGKVIAHILPLNTASLKVVERAGFKPERRFVDTDGEEVEQWAWVKPGGKR
jgi:[ribosomal protein S5]-alanine N-acetyltransferase